MRRSTLLGLSLLSLGAVLAGGSAARAQGPPSARDAYPDRVKAIRKRLSKSYYNLGQFCAERKCLEFAVPQFERAMALDPDNEFVRKKLGYRKEKGAWVRDPKVKVDRTNDGAASLEVIQATEEQVKKKQEDLSKQAAGDLIGLAGWCEKEGLEEESRLHYGEVLDYDLHHEKAREALGFRRTGSRWVHAREKDLKSQTEEAMKTASEGEAVSEQTDVERALGKELAKRRTSHILIQGPFNEATARKFARLAEVTCALALKSLGRDPASLGTGFEIVFVATLADHAKYVDAFVEASPEHKKMLKEQAGGVLDSPRHEWIYLDPGLAQDMVVHSATHFVFGSAHAPPGKPWMTCGAAYWFSGRLLDTAFASCLPTEHARGAEPMPKVEDLLALLTPSRWRSDVRRSVADHTDPDISTVLGASLDNAQPEQIVKGWSLVDFLLSDPERGRQFGLFLDRLYAGVPQDKAILEIFGWTYEELEAKWRTFVRTHY
ncbi:MAG: tetratricopeptide repeat protein [Planctomycetes bacterium]|nr:tetratricopeptide repeat protein [Planctomycetota bacterium]